MGDPKQELRELIGQIKVRLEFLRELGVETFDLYPPARAPQAQIVPEREAVPEAQASASQEASTARRAQPDMMTTTARDTSGRAKIGGNIEEESEVMARSKTTKRSATPPPQETLFGEITPKDEASLPRPGETLEDIRRDIDDCTRCPLHKSRTQIVNSEGNPHARLMFVGEAPGADEDAQGHPFVGRAGQLLNKIIEAIGMKREDVFIGNVNRCRPPQNRTPTASEAATCKPFLLREIAVVRPEVIVVLGNTAMQNLLGTKEGITKMRGRFHDFNGIKVMPTFHPAYLLRDPSKKREAWEDMKKVRDYLNGTLKLD